MKWLAKASPPYQCFGISPDKDLAACRIDMAAASWTVDGSPCWLELWLQPGVWGACWILWLSFSNSVAIIDSFVWRIPHASRITIAQREAI